MNTGGNTTEKETLAAGASIPVATTWLKMQVKEEFGTAYRMRINRGRGYGEARRKARRELKIIKGGD